MTSILIAILGTCFAYQANRFRKAGMHLFALAYSISVALMLAGFIFRWPDTARWPITVVAIVLLVAGAYQLRKHPDAGTPTSAKRAQALEKDN